MSAPAASSIAELRGPILRAVSRSFYLSIRLLPNELRDPIALAYLLARATDTIADTASIEPSLRVQELANLAAQIQNRRDVLPHVPNFAIERESNAKDGDMQKHIPPNGAERTLLEAVPTCLEWLRSMPAEDGADIRDVLLKINEGQTLDVQRFADASRLTALETSADLIRYTYLVAGCVGEFWTRVCFRHQPRFSTRDREEMLSLGASYGRGLQLVNILRDSGADLRAGRCYLPAEELRAAGMSPADIATAPARALPIVNNWRVRAEEGMAAGIEYACAIRPWRVRLATVLPALIGARTLALLRAAGPGMFETKVKVRRAEVRRILFKMIATLASPRAIRASFKTLSA